jgi:hypothetical protein
MLNRSAYLLNPYFISGLLLLIVNDHFLKWEYHNWWTGKLSDFAGVFILPFFLAFLFNGKARLTVVITGLFFLFWKAPLSQILIESYNDFAIIPISRVVDYSDYLAFAMLPLSYVLLSKEIRMIKCINRWMVYPFLGISCIAFMATSPPIKYYYQMNDGETQPLSESFTVRRSEAEILEKLRVMGIEVYQDSTFAQRKSRNQYDAEYAYINLIESDSLQYAQEIMDSLSLYRAFKDRVRHLPYYYHSNQQGALSSYYRIDHLIIAGDTLENIQFSIQELSKRRSKIHLNGIDLDHLTLAGSASDDLYSKLLKEYTKDILKK